MFGIVDLKLSIFIPRVCCCTRKQLGIPTWKVKMDLLVLPVPWTDLRDASQCSSWNNLIRTATRVRTLLRVILGRRMRRRNGVTRGPRGELFESIL